MPEDSKTARFSCLTCGDRILVDVSFLMDAVAGIRWAAPRCCEAPATPKILPHGIRCDDGWIYSIADRVPVYSAPNTYPNCGMPADVLAAASASDYAAAARELMRTPLRELMLRDPDYGDGPPAPGFLWSIESRSWVPSDALRLRSAMAAMSNVMNNVLLLADTGYESRLIEFTENRQREGDKVYLGRDSDRITADASAAWSRRVRAGVAALPKPGPVMCCQSEED